MYASHARTGVLRYPLDWSRLLPFLRWRDRVTRQNSRDDALSGLTGALIVLPQAAAVILSTTEVLLDDERLSDKQKTRIGRIERAASDMTSEGAGIAVAGQAHLRPLWLAGAPRKRRRPWHHGHGRFRLSGVQGIAA
jgi:hypothetical protein